MVGLHTSYASDLGRFNFGNLVALLFRLSLHANQPGGREGGTLKFHYENLSELGFVVARLSSTHEVAHLRRVQG